MPWPPTNCPPGGCTLRICAGTAVSVPDPPWTLEQHAADVLATMDDLGIERAAVMGQSMGAVVAVYLSRQAPQRVDRLILLDPAMGVPSPARQSARP